MRSRRVVLLVALAAASFAGACSPMPSTVPDADAVIADLAPGFLRCYEDELGTSPTMAGNVRLEARIDVYGRVADVAMIADGSLTPTVLGCLERHMLSARFSEPDLGVATIVVPMTFALADGTPSGP